MTRDDRSGSAIGRALRWLTSTPDHDDWLDPGEHDALDDLRARIEVLEAEIAALARRPS